MSKCLVTKLNGSSNNTELLRLGEMKISINKIDSPNKVTQGFNFIFNKAVKLEIIGNGNFTDDTLTVNKGKQITLTPNVSHKVYVSNDDFDVAILDKYSIVRMFNYAEYDPSINYASKNKFISNIDVFKYSKALTSLSLSNTKVSGDIANLKELTSLTSLSLSNTKVSGDIANLKELTSLTSLSLYNTKVSGDIANLKELTSLTSLSLSNTKVSGDIANLKTLTALTKLELYNKNLPITGNIGELSTLLNCNYIIIYYSKLTGDLAVLPSACKYISAIFDKGSVFTWSNRPTSAKILAINTKASLTNIDKMLQDQAKCQVGFTPSDPIAHKTISVTGNRTSASDDAVATLQQKGYTVSINPA